ncbi:ABC transporter ATP-binding protein [Paenibacillus sp. CAU 1782]
MADSLVEIQAVHKIFKGKTVVSDLSMEIGRGEVVALCGGNGAGKSTLLRMLGGILRPSGGSIAIDGVTWGEDRAFYARQIGYMPDDYRFSPGLTALETMLFWARLRGLGKPRAKEVLELVGLSDTGGKPVASFSKGMRQRVLFAQALLAKPPLLIMDEPTNGLDPYWMESFVALVLQAAGSGQTVVFSTHQLQIAEALGDRYVFLRDGNLALDGKKEEMDRQYGSAGLQRAFGELFGLK